MSGKKRQNKTTDEQLNPTIRAKIILLRLGLTPADVAGGTGLTRDYCYRLLEGSRIATPGRKKIEEFLGEAIWSEATQ